MQRPDDTCKDPSSRKQYLTAGSGLRRLIRNSSASRPQGPFGSVRMSSYKERDPTWHGFGTSHRRPDTLESAGRSVIATHPARNAQQPDSAYQTGKRIEKRILPSFGHLPFAALDADRVGAWKASLATSGLKPASVNS